MYHTNIQFKKRILRYVSLHRPLFTSSGTTIADETRNTFLYGKNITYFSDMSLSKELVDVLAASGKSIATSIQTKAYDPIRNKKNVIIGAETGSGKTLTYLIPLIQTILDNKRKVLITPPSLVPSADTNEDDDVDKVSISVYPKALVMVPNKELCQQVYKMAKEIEFDGIMIDYADTATGSSWPYRRVEDPNKVPDILICTPSFLCKFLRGPAILDEELFLSIKHLVLDEADMLMEGSYQVDLEMILDAFKVTRRNMIRRGEIQVHESVLQTIIVAATLPSSGLRSIENYVDDKFPNSIKISNDYLHKHHPRITQTFYRMKGGDDGALLSDDRLNLIVNAIYGSNEALATIEPYTTVIDAVDIGYTFDPKKLTMVFVNTANECSNLAMRLREKGVDCSEFHKNLLPDKKAHELRKFREGEATVLICTDHAARGLDLPNVHHVIQADFALNVVQYLHRIGRASRAGAVGKATNIFDNRNDDLVNSILSDSDNSDKSIKQSFSRRRGFRRVIKKMSSRQLDNAIL